MNATTARKTSTNAAAKTPRKASTSTKKAETDTKSTAASPVSAKTPFIAPSPFTPELAPDIMGIFGTIKANKELMGYMTPEGMAGLLFISNFEKVDPDSPAPDKHGYQREPIEERIPGIARFFLQEGGATIPALTLSVRLHHADEIERFVTLFNRGDKMGMLTEFGQSVISVVDGQHRFLGLVRAWNMNPEFNPRIPVTLKFGLTFEEEARLFDTINSTQRKLPRALIEATKVDITEVGSVNHAQSIRLITSHLIREKDSAWHNRINMTGARNPERPITYEGLRRSTGSMFPKELLEQLDATELEPQDVALDYWNLVAEACESAWNSEPITQYSEEDGSEVEVAATYRINELVGVAALAKLGQKIISSAMEHEDFNGRLKDLVSRLSEVNWEKSKDNPWMRNQQAGFAGQRDLYTMLHNWVYSNRKPV